MSPIQKTQFLLLAAALASGCPLVTAPAPPPLAKVAPPASPVVAAPPAIQPGTAEPAQVAAGASGESSGDDVAPAGAAAGASTTKADTAAADAIPLDLTPYYGMKADRFDAVKQYPWNGVPRGSQKFAGVPLEIGGSFSLFGEENAKRGLKFPEELKGIPVGRPFEALYICHAAFFEAPAGTPICEVRFQYDDGTTESDKIVCGSDVRDWYVNAGDKELGPTGKRSTLAWSGEGLANGRPQKIRFFLTAITNPQPEKTVQTIDLVSTKSRAASCVLAMTTGKAGLLQPARAAEETEE